MSRSLATLRSPLSLLFGLALVLATGGCGVGSDDAALDSDANGFICLDCRAKFYTDRKVFANHCPDCKKGHIEMVVGFVCPVDNEVTYTPRGRGAAACQTCGKVTNRLVIPSKKELIAWGAAYKTGPEVGVP